MEKVTYIMPVHEFNDTVKGYMTKAFKSVEELKGAETSEILFVGDLETIIKAQQLFNEVVSKDNTQIVTLVPTDEKDLFKKINLAVTKSTTPYFSVVEFDDVYYPYWNEVAQRYLKENQYSIVMPFNEIMSPDGTVIGLANEISWDAAFIGEANLGFLKVEDLLIFKDFIVSGSFINRKDFIELGMLEPSYKIAAWYDYLLKTVSSGKEIFVAPRIGYKHTVAREGSYLATIANELSTEEGAKIIQEVISKYKKPEIADVNTEQE